MDDWSERTGCPRLPREKELERTDGEKMRERMEDREVHYRVREWAEGDRPRERLRDRGPGALHDAELLAILLRVGNRGESAVALAQRLLAKYGGLDGVASAGFSALSSLSGMGLAKASQIMAGFELGRRVSGRARPFRPEIRSARDVYDILGPRLRDEKKESFWVLLLDQRHRLQNAVRISEGSLSMTLVHPREAFQPAIRDSAAAVLFVHNHPSGDPEPSSDDWSLTGRLKECGEILGIRVLDHVVLGDHAWVSLEERGALKSRFPG